MMRARAVALALVIASVATMAVVAPTRASGAQTPAGFGEPEQALVTELMNRGVGRRGIRTFAEAEALFEEEVGGSSPSVSIARPDVRERRSKDCARR